MNFTAERPMYRGGEPVISVKTEQRIVDFWKDRGQTDIERKSITGFSREGKHFDYATMLRLYVGDLTVTLEAAGTGPYGVPSIVTVLAPEYHNQDFYHFDGSNDMGEDDLMSVLAKVMDRLPDWQRRLEAARDEMYVTLQGGLIINAKGRVLWGEELDAMREDIKRRGDCLYDVHDIDEFDRYAAAYKERFGKEWEFDAKPPRNRS